MTKTISFRADKVDVGKKRADGTRVVELHVGEYEHEKLKDILDVPDQVVVVELKFDEFDE